MTELAVGTNVDIQRTNGRIHSAVISSIDWDNKSVTVEWSEANEIKGKEIDFETVFLLNPSLSSHVNNTPPSSQSICGIPRKMGPPARPSAVPVPSSKGSMRVRPFNNRQTIANGNGVALEPIIQSQPLSQIPPPTTTGIRKSTVGTTATINCANVASNNNGSNGIDNAARRRSNVVKEVDKIKKQREERRARQEREKQDKAELMQAVDQGNPNWEFLGMIREYRAQLEYRPITMNDSVNEHQICVAVRKRPMNKKEMSRKDIDVVTVPDKELIMVHEPKQKVDLTRYLDHQCFRFDYSFDETSTNELVYKYTAKPLINTIFEGGMATCFAYGQTGSGKTHTMGGDFSGKTQDSTKGIYALSARDVFKLLKSPKYRSEDLLVYASFFEIYSGKVFDLLNGKAKLRVLEDARQQVQVVGLTEKMVESVEDVLKIISTGNNIRTSGVTSANNHSSRSHAVFQIILKKRTNNRMHGKFSLIDLAGNERGADTSSSSRVTRMEGAEINKSLLALKECIRALGRRGAHLPFRASKLTQVLRDSFIGENSRTCMIAMISPGMQSCEHSLNTLRYANRVKELGAEGGPEMKNSDGDEMMEESPNENNGGLMHRNGNSMHDDDYSEEMVTFHEAISHLQDMEEEVLDLHKNYYDCFPRWMQTNNTLLKMTQEVDYDVDGYSQQLEEIVDEELNLLQTLKEKVTAFRSGLAAEELMSKKIVIKKK